MFCVALCVALSTQMTIVVLDHLQHAFNVDHAPNALAGSIVFHDRGVPPHTHLLGDDGGPAHGHHSHGEIPDDHDSLAHHHYGPGMLAPWLVSPMFVYAVSPLPDADYDYNETTHPDAPAWRRDRPPKLNLERMV
jgi:hypothetical protein